MMSTHIHTRNYYGKFSGTTSDTGTLEHERSTLIGSEVCGVPVSPLEVCETGTRPEHAQPQQPNSAALFVSTALSCWKTDRPDAFNRDVQINDTAYRRLDPEYYAWLRSRMNMAKLAVLAGQLAQESFDGLRGSFNRIHEWAMARLGSAALAEAVRTLDARDYRPPAAEPLTNGAPAHGSACTQEFTRKNQREVSRAAIAIVDEICEKALALGWNHDRLYRVPDAGATGIPAGSGLVCYLREGQRIGEVTRQSIEIVGPAPLEIRQRFYNPDVDQPWFVKPARREK